MRDANEILEKILTRLNLASVADESDRSVDWPETLEPESWFMAPELISLYGTPTYDALDEKERQRLSFFEAMNFFSLNVHGEKALVSGLSERLYRQNGRRGSSLRIRGYDDYLHHFLAEENHHMSWFGGFCARYGKGLYPDKKVAFPSEDAAEGEEEFLFFSKILIFEEIVDAYNVRCAKDERLHPLIRRINALHHRDETRHLAFGRQVVQATFEYGSRHWDAQILERVRNYLLAYLDSTWKEYFNPQVYTDAGILGNALALRREAFGHTASLERRMRIERPCLDFFYKNGMLESTP